MFDATLLITLWLSLIANTGCHWGNDRALPGPEVVIRSAPALRLRGADSPALDKPGECDCNSPAHWDGDTLYVFCSAGHPWRCSGPDIFNLTNAYLRCEYDNKVSGGRWIECTWKAQDGVLYGWYHHEPAGICAVLRPELPKVNLTAPRIGAVRSTDNGRTWQDLGVVLETPPNSLNCQTKNYYFAGGNGDFSVMLDVREQFLYFFFSSYPDIFAEQGFAVARMRWEDRDQPSGKVWKWHQEHWSEPGLGGHITPIFPAKISWHHTDANAFWGPSIHWNSHLHTYVVLLNHSKDGNFTQEGIYFTFNADLSNPSGWTAPRKLSLPETDLAWYPQVLGADKTRRETDKAAGRLARLFIRGASRWEILFLNHNEPR
jgi:hypothetical protein